MATIINGKEFEVKQVGNRFFYWSVKAGGRWLPVKKSEVIWI